MNQFKPTNSHTRCIKLVWKKQEEVVENEKKEDKYKVSYKTVYSCSCFSKPN